MTESAGPLRVMEETPAYWRIIFDYPPFTRCGWDDVPSSARPARTHKRRSKLARGRLESANHDFLTSGHLI